MATIVTIQTADGRALRFLDARPYETVLAEVVDVEIRNPFLGIRWSESVPCWADSAPPTPRESVAPPPALVPYEVCYYSREVPGAYGFQTVLANSEAHARDVWVSTAVEFGYGFLFATAQAVATAPTRPDTPPPTLRSH